MSKRILSTDHNLASFFLRIALGGVMFPHGCRMAFGWFGGDGYAMTIRLFAETLNFPAWLTVAVMVIELAGSVALITGLLTRVAAFGIGATLGLCAYMENINYGFFMNWYSRQTGEGIEYHILAIGIALALLLKGGGFLSLDGLITREKT